MTEPEAPEKPPRRVVHEREHVAPSAGSESFHCPNCGVLAQMAWRTTSYEPWQKQPMAVLGSGGGPPITTTAPVLLARCQNCNKIQVWVAYGEEPDVEPYWRLVKPIVGGGERPHPDMPADVREDYEEARAIVGSSTRGACGLLRLATEKLVNELQPEGSNLNDRIGKMVAAGLPPQVQQALDALRVIGNEAVHPGELNLQDDLDTATGLFALMNIIVEDRIARPKQIAEMYAKLPPNKLAGIINRDGAT